ncbi:hypothetical protein N665_0618s0008 [Sinapis alba]|nr:hypothetical protein N665_0618s0008 [Sinapis alba]
MSSEGRLSRKQKGKAVATESSPPRDADGTPLNDFELIHRDAMMDTRSLGLSQRLLVSESARLHQGGIARTTTEVQVCARDGQGGARDGIPPVDFVPICYYPGRIFEELPSLSPELLRSPEARAEAVVTANRFQCVYESYFQDDTNLGFPIPRFVTLYARRRDTTIRQFLNGSWRLAVALMVMATEIDVTLNVRAFEELTSINPLDEGLWSVKMRPNYNVVKGYPNKMVDWQRGLELYLHSTQNTVKRRISIFTRDEQREINASRGNIGLPDLSAMMASQQGLSRPEPVDPPSEVRATEMDEAVLGRHDLSSVAAAAPSRRKSNKKRSRDYLPSHKACETSPKQVDAAGRTDVIESPRARKKKKQPSDRRSSVRVEPTLNLPLADDPDDVSPLASLQLREKSKKTKEQGMARLEAPPVVISNAAANPSVSEGSTLPTPGTSTSGVPVLKKVPGVVFRDHVSFEYDGPTPLIYVPHKCAELVSQIRGGPRPFPPVAELIFKDEYIDSAHTNLLGDGSMNFVIEKYDPAQKEVIANSEKLKEKAAAKGRFFCRKKAEWEAAYEEMSAKRERAIAQRKIHQERAYVADADLRVAHSTILALEMRTGKLEEKIGLGTKNHKKEMERLRESRVFEVTKERVRVETEMIAKCNKRFTNIHVYQTHRASFDTIQLLQSQAFGTRKCLEALKAGGRIIPQETIDMFAAQEKQFEEEALKLNIGDIPEADLALSPLRLDSQFVDEQVMDTSVEGQGDDREEEQSVDGREDEVVEDDAEDAAKDQDAANCETSQPPPSPDVNVGMSESSKGFRLSDKGNYANSLKYRRSENENHQSF